MNITMSTASKSQVLKLAELAAYQDASIVSHQILKADAGNVTLFAFADGQELSEHTSPHDALVYILDGQAEVRLDGVAHTLKAGEAIIMPANVPHALKATTNFRMLLTMVRI